MQPAHSPDQAVAGDVATQDNSTPVVHILHAKRKLTASKDTQEVTKTARFSEPDVAHQAQSDTPTAGEEAAVQSGNTDDDKLWKAQDAITLCMVSSEEEIQGWSATPERPSGLDEAGTPGSNASRPPPSFRPEYTHQLFAEEQIAGVQPGGADVRCWFAAGSLECIVDVNVTGPEEGTDPSDVREDIVGRLGPAILCALRADAPNGREAFRERLQADEKFVPPGTSMHRYSAQGKQFEVFHATAADCPGLADYHNRAQGFAMWYIETAENVDITREQWEVLYVFERRERQVPAQAPEPADSTQGCRYLFVGFTTVFRFRNPFNPLKGVTLRICSALVLPLYQRQGHGGQLMRCVYRMARDNPAVQEVTVEDPAPGYVALRDTVESQLCRELGAFPPEALQDPQFRCLTRDELQHAQEVAKITRAQASRAFEILRLATLAQDDPEELRRYRLMVKRRINQGLALKDEDPRAKEVRKVQLDKEYQELAAHYTQLL